MTLPPLNKPIQHNGSPECPVHPDTRVSGNYLWATAFKSAAGLVDWRNVTTYTIIARAPADEIAALQARVTELEGALAGAEHDQSDLLFECRKYADAAEADEKKRMRTLRADAVERRLERTRAALKGNPNAHD